MSEPWEYSVLSWKFRQAGIGTGWGSQRQGNSGFFSRIAWAIWRHSNFR